MKVSKILVSAPNKVGFIINEERIILEPENEVLIENVYSHISTGTEMACLAGLEDWFSFPNTPGYTSIGRIVGTSKNIKHLNIGDFVYTFGPHKSYFKINITDRWHGICVEVPKNMNLQLAAFTHMASIAITALRKSKIALGDWVAISGMGVIGNLCAQLCQLQGARVIGIDILESRLKIASDCRIEFTLNSSNGSFEEQLLKITKGEKVNTFIDASGVSSVIEKSAKVIAKYGELILLGSPRTEYRTDLTSFLQHIHLWSHGAIEVKGALEFSYPTYQNEHNRHSIERNSSIILDLIHTKKIKVDSLISAVAKPETASETYDSIKKYPERYLGVIFDWQ